MEEGGKKREMRGGAKARGRKGKEAHDRVDRDGSRRRPRYVRVFRMQMDLMEKEGLDPPSTRTLRIN